MSDIESILKILPHRYPFILVDRVLEFKSNTHLRALKNVTINEPFFQGHYPVKKLMPGVLIIESLAQACALLYINDEEKNELKDKGGLILLSGMDKVKFLRQVTPGDQLILDISLKRKFNLSNKNGGIIFFIYETEAYVDDQLVASAIIKLVLKLNIL